MKTNNLREQVKELLQDSVNVQEYQDKFYFVKNLKILLPEIPEDKIYKAIEITNLSLKPPRKKKDYVDLLIKKLLNFNTGFIKNDV
ncbi:MAG: hypothetical protein P8Z35_13015 [Ignavibacteriaceae bacterium]